MRDLPVELLYVLIFIGMVLVQYVLKRLAARAPAQPAADADTRPARGSAAELAAREHLAPGARPPAQLPAPGPDRFEAPAEHRAQPRRRFARQSLLGTRTAVQNAVVIAAIIGPCRALEPRE